MSQERWDAFLTKVAARADEICAEAEAGFDALIATEVLDPIPLASAMSEFHARMLGLGKKIDESWGKLGLDDDALRERGRALEKRIDRQSKVLQVKKHAKAARAVQQLAEHEMQKVRAQTKCSGCGAPLQPKVLHEPSNETCAHCKAVSVVRPGMATLMLFQGACLHAFGEEAALDEGERLEAAVEQYRAVREKHRRDVDAYVAAHRQYWLVYARGYGACVPGWNEQKSKELAEAKLGFLKLELERTPVAD
jgi:hypothetical protein